MEPSRRILSGWQTTLFRIETGREPEGGFLKLKDGCQFCRGVGGATDREADSPDQPRVSGNGNRAFSNIANFLERTPALSGRWR